MTKGNLLLVDDETLILDRLKVILDDKADKIFIASSGPSALELLNSQTIHCVICDISMPKMTGIEVIKAIRKKNNNVPFIFYTAYGNQAMMMEALKYGAFDFLCKPNLEGLEEIVTKGLKEGLNQKVTKEENKKNYVSEYQVLLEKMGSNNKID